MKGAGRLVTWFRCERGGEVQVGDSRLMELTGLKEDRSSRNERKFAAHVQKGEIFVSLCIWCSNQIR